MNLKKICIALVVSLAIAVPSYAQSTLSLSQSKELALKNNIKIKNAKNEYDISIKTKESAYTKYFPKVSAMGAAMYSADYLMKMKMEGGNLPVYDGNPVNLKNPTQYAYFPGIDISMMDKIYFATIMAMQPVYAGGRISNGNELAELATEIYDEKQALTKNEVMLKTEELYWQVYSLYEKKKTVEAYEKMLDTLKKDVATASDAGLALKNDLMKVSIKLSEVQLNKIKVNNGIEIATRAFCQYIGIDYKDNLLLVDELPANPGLPEAYFVKAEEALPKRHEYGLLKKAVEAEKLQTEIKRGEFLPQLAVGISGFYMKAIGDGAFNAVGFATVSIPISDWWGGSHEIEEHRIKETIARNNQKESNDLMLVQINKAWTDLNEAYRQIQLGDDMLKQTEENLKIEQTNYQSGVSSLSDLLQAQAMHQQSQDQLIDYRTQYQKAITNYIQVTGR